MYVCAIIYTKDVLWNIFCLYEQVGFFDLFNTIQEYYHWPYGKVTQTRGHLVPIPDIWLQGQWSA